MLDTNLDIFTGNTLLQYWNRYFNSNIKFNVHNTITVDDFFNMYLDEYNKDNNYNYCNKIVLLTKDENNIRVSSAEKSNELIKTKRDLDDCWRNFEIIITDFSFDNANKIVLRKEVIENIYTSNHTHFFSKDLPFSYNDNRVFFTDTFYNLLMSDKNIFDTIYFESKLLNYFENGNNYNGLIIKPVVNISNYGRWYFSGCKIQNNKKFRNEVENKLKEINTVITFDIVSGEPTMLANITGCQLISDLIKVRMNVSKEYSNMLKNMLNIYFHSLLPPKQSYNWFIKDNKDVCERFEKEYDVSILKLYEDIDKETNEYNKKIIQFYKNDLSVVENDRRIVNPATVIMKEKDIIKNHRNYLQGHVNSVVIKMLKLLCDRNIISMNNIVYTIFDSFTLLVNEYEAEDIKKEIKKISKEMNIFMSVE